MVAALPSRLRARPRDRDLVQHRIDLGELAQGDDLVVALLLAIAREALHPQLVPAETPAIPAGGKASRPHAPHRQRAAERRGGTESVSNRRYRWSPNDQTNNE